MKDGTIKWAITGAMALAAGAYLYANNIEAKITGDVRDLTLEVRDVLTEVKQMVSKVQYLRDQITIEAKLSDRPTKADIKAVEKKVIELDRKFVVLRYKTIGIASGRPDTPD